MAHDSDGSSLNDGLASSSHPSVSSLYDYTYKLYSGQAVNPDDLMAHPATSCSGLIYNACVNLLQRFDSLNSVERSYLHVLFSSCLSTIQSSCRTTLVNIIGNDKLNEILAANSNSKTSHALNDDVVYKKVKTELQHAYQQNEIKGVKMYILREKARIVEHDLELAEAFTMEILDIVDFAIQMVCRCNWISSTLSEEDFRFYWKYTIEILFRDSSIVLKRGESCSTSTKTDRQINELEYGDCSCKVSGENIFLPADEEDFDAFLHDTYSGRAI